MRGFAEILALFAIAICIYLQKGNSLESDTNQICAILMWMIALGWQFLLTVFNATKSHTTIPSQGLTGQTKIITNKCPMEKP